MSDKISYAVSKAAACILEMTWSEMEDFASALRGSGLVPDVDSGVQAGLLSWAKYTKAEGDRQDAADRAARVARTT